MLLGPTPDGKMALRGYLLCSERASDRPVALEALRVALKSYGAQEEPTEARGVAEWVGGARVSPCTLMASGPESFYLNSSLDHAFLRAARGLGATARALPGADATLCVGQPMSAWPLSARHLAERALLDMDLPGGRESSGGSGSKSL